jgi:hypothetical protein
VEKMTIADFLIELKAMNEEIEEERKAQIQAQEQMKYMRSRHGRK